ncbi:hypothetical protein [Bradyrhizobium sp. SRS-191]|uniref:hypothetical protein n=1 Tax=Bradyrhizobium sp. SRS-191 TaxID=2962606 RepID=UPI00211F1D26|nr:hypothetical protein [Bradyrhizobium sp. SRS-191]
MVTASLHRDPGFELRSAQFAQIVEAAEQATTAKPVPFPSRGPVELVACAPPCSPRRQETGHVTSIGNALNARRYKVRRCPGQTVQQRLKFDGKRLRTGRTKNLHRTTPDILSNVQNIYRIYERRSRNFSGPARKGEQILPGAASTPRRNFKILIIL